MGSLEGNEGYGSADYFLVGKDFPSYIECQEKIDEAYRDQRVSDQTFSVCYTFCHFYTLSQHYLYYQLKFVLVCFVYAVMKLAHFSRPFFRKPEFTL